MEAIKQLARERMKGKCRVCPVCDGRVCSGEVPGMGGAGTGSAFRANIEALAKVKLAMRCLHDAAMPDTSTEVLGLKLALPVMAAPIGGVAFNMGGPEQNPVDEAKYAEAIIAGSKQAGTIGCGGDGVPPVISGSAFASIRNADGWGIPFIKPWEGEEVWTKLEASIATGCPVVGMDVDAAGLVTLRLMGRPVAPTNPAKLAELAKFVHDRGAKFMIKGVMTVVDAKIAAEAGVDAIVVSNHGGRVLDGTPGGVDVLPAIVEAVGDKIEVLVDGGIRSGTDVLKCLALGAKAVLIGRPLSVAAVGGETEGVVKYFAQIKGQLTSAMALTGCATVADISKDILA